MNVTEEMLVAAAEIINGFSATPIAMSGHCGCDYCGIGCSGTVGMD